MAIGHRIKSGCQTDLSHQLALQWEFTHLTKPSRTSLVCSMRTKHAGCSEDYARKLLTDEYPSGPTTSQAVVNFLGNTIVFVWYQIFMLFCVDRLTDDYIPRK